MINVEKISTGLSDLQEEIEVLEDRIQANKMKLKALKPTVSEYEGLRKTGRQLRRELKSKKTVLETISEFVKEPVQERQMEMFPAPGNSYQIPAKA
jgi:predicted RNase H-like nuclease (RuvC/YqgF family)